MKKKIDLSEVEGICFSFLPEHIARIKKMKSILFPKISVHQVAPLFTQKGHKFFFYVSHSDKRIVAEGTIKEVELTSYEEFLDKLKKSFITREEFDKYINGRMSKRIVTFNISNIVFYKKPIYPGYYVTMGWKYILKNEYSSWFSRHQHEQGL